MTPKQKELARHALGLPNRKKTTNRNHYCVGAGCDGHEEWEALVAEGLAVKRTGTQWGGDDMFYLTLEAAKLARENSEHISREDAEGMHRIGAALARVSTGEPSRAEGAKDTCPKCGHPNHKSRMHQDICTFYVAAMGAECGCSHPQSAGEGDAAGGER